MQSRRNCVTTCTNSLKGRGKGGCLGRSHLSHSVSQIISSGKLVRKFQFHSSPRGHAIGSTDGPGSAGRERPHRAFQIPLHPLSASRSPQPPSAPSAAGPARASHIQTAEGSLTVTLAPQCHFESNGRRGEPRPRDSAHQSRAALGFKDPNSSFDWLLAALSPPPTRPPLVSPPLWRGAFLIGRWLGFRLVVVPVARGALPSGFGGRRSGAPLAQHEAGHAVR